MKHANRLLALTLSLILTLSLALSAHAYDDAYWDGRSDGYDAGWQAGYDDATAGIAPEQTNDYDAGYESGFHSGYEDGYDSFLYESEAQQETAQQIRDWGGVPGKLNVMVDGKMLAFDKVWPVKVNNRVMIPARSLLERMGAKVTYQGGVLTAKWDEKTLTHKIGSLEYTVTEGEAVSTRTMDCRSYLQKGVAMVSMRYFAEPFGYDAYWDEDYQCGVLVLEQKLWQDMSDQTYVANLILSDLRSRTYPVDTYLRNTNAAFAMTVFDTLKGNKTYRATASAQQIFNNAAVDTTLELDLTEVFRQLERDDPDIWDDADAPALAILQKLELRTIYDVRTGSVYLRMPQLDAYTGGAYWLQTSLQEIVDMTPDELQNFGSLSSFCWMVVCDQYSPAHYYEQFSQATTDMVELLGDQNFQKSGNTYSLKIDNALAEKLLGLDEGDLYWSLGSNGSIDLRLSVTDTGNATCNYTGSFELKSDDMQWSITLNKTGPDSGLTFIWHEKNVSEMKLTVSSVCTRTDRTAAPQPPENEMTKELDEAFT